MEDLSSAPEQHQHQELQDNGEEIKYNSFAAKDTARERSQALQVGLATVNRDISYLRDEINLKRISENTLMSGCQRV
jgi:hypothetical protein